MTMTLNQMDYFIYLFEKDATDKDGNVLHQAFAKRRNTMFQLKMMNNVQKMKKIIEHEQDVIMSKVPKGEHIDTFVKAEQELVASYADASNNIPPEKREEFQKIHTALKADHPQAIKELDEFRKMRSEHFENAMIDIKEKKFQMLTKENELPGDLTADEVLELKPFIAFNI